MEDDGILIGATEDGTPVFDATGDGELIFFGSPIKDLGGGKVGGYLVRYTSDADPDLTGDFFDAKTQITVPDGMPVFYNHGLDNKLKRRVIGKATTGTDETGLWVEAQLNMRDEYEKAIYHMALQGKLGWSSGALSHLVDREPAGKAMHIKTWVVGEASLTPTPAEYRNAVVTLKSLEASEQAALTDEDVETMSTSTKEKPMDGNKEEVKAVAPEDVKALIAAALAEREAAQKAEAEKQAALKAAEEDGYKKAVEDLKARKPFKYHTTEKVSDDNDGVQAFKSWVSTGQENHGLIVADSTWDTKAAWNQTTGASGAFLIPDPLYAQVIAKRDNASWVRQAPTQIFQTVADHLLVPYEDTSHTNFVLTSEAGSYNENEGTVAQKDLVLYKYTNLTKANEEFLMFNQVNWDSWFAGAMARAVAGTENSIYTDGTGSSQPEGVGATNGSTAANTTATDGIILPSELTAFFGYLGDGYNVASECAILMHTTTLWYLLGITSSGYKVFDTPFAQSAPNEKRILGYRVIVDDDVDVYTTNAAKIMFFGNFNYYGVVERPGIMVQRNPYLYMATGQIGIFSSIFRGGGTLQKEAIVHMLDAT